MYMDVSYLSKWRIRISSMQSLWYGISVVQKRLSGKKPVWVCVYVRKKSLVKSRLFLVNLEDYFMESPLHTYLEILS